MLEKQSDLTTRFRTSAEKEDAAMGIGLTILERTALCPIVYSTELCLRNVAWGTRICLHSEKCVCVCTHARVHMHTLQVLE